MKALLAAAWICVVGFHLNQMDTGYNIAHKKKKPTFMTYKIHKYNRLNKKDFKIMYAIKSNNYIFFTIKMHDIKEKTFLTVY